MHLVETMDKHALNNWTPMLENTVGDGRCQDGHTSVKRHKNGCCQNTSNNPPRKVFASKSPATLAWKMDQKDGAGENFMS